MPHSLTHPQRNLCIKTAQYLWLGRTLYQHLVHHFQHLLHQHRIVFHRITGAPILQAQPRMLDELLHRIGINQTVFGLIQALVHDGRKFQRPNQLVHFALYPCAHRMAVVVDDFFAIIVGPIQYLARHPTINHVNRTAFKSRHQFVPTGWVVFLDFCRPRIDVVFQQLARFFVSEPCANLLKQAYEKDLVVAVALHHAQHLRQSVPQTFAIVLLLEQLPQKQRHLFGLDGLHQGGNLFHHKRRHQSLMLDIGKPIQKFAAGF